MPEIYKQIVIVGIAGVMTVLRGVGTPPSARPGAAIVSTATMGQVNALRIYFTATSAASTTPESSPEASATPQTRPQRSFAVASATATPTHAPPAPTRKPATPPPAPAVACAVLYAEPSRITLKYTREDNVAVGYTLHLESVCIEPRLLALYRSLNAAGRRQLPALRNGQPFGIATGGQILIGIRDSGTWMDPRSRKDWW